MAQVETRAPDGASRPGEIGPPSVLVVMVVRDGAAWLPLCLAGLSRQTHPRIRVLAVDNGSTDGSGDLLEAALGRDRVIRRGENAGFPGAVGEALRSDQAHHADYVLFLHDDTILEPAAVTGMVEAAERLEGVGIVGPKVLDWERPEMLREIGLSTDRFGYAYSPLEEGEIDQGQYDRIREVLSVSSCAMLVSKRTWTRIGPPDERLSSGHEDLDYCWRARVAGFRVLMTPAAVARHRGASMRGERTNSAEVRGRYQAERAALASVLKNYGLLSLAWILPLYVSLGLARLAILAIGRRFQDAYQLVAAWGWNVAHLPGTVHRRVRAQAVRTVPDRSVRRSMAPTAIRLRRWAQAAAQSFLPARDEAEEAAPVPGRVRALRLAAAHPVAAAWAVAAVLALISYRHLIGASPLVGGGLGVPPRSASGFFVELLSGLRHTGLGGTTAASPALGFLGLGSVVAFGSPALLLKVLVLGLPAAAAAGCYRTVRAQVEEALPAVVAGAAYGLSGVVLWALSEGRIPELVFLAGLPWLATKLSFPFGSGFRMAPRRWIVGAGLGLAVLGSFFPGVILAVCVLVLALVATPSSGSRRARGIALLAGALAVAGALVFPLTLELLRNGGRGLGDAVGHRSFVALARLSPGKGPGSWPTGFLLPVGAALGLVFVRGRFGALAVRSTISAVACLYLAWLAAGGYLPGPLANPIAYLGLAAFSFAMLLGLGLSAVLRGVARAEFGHRQLGVVLMTAVLLVGLGGQMAQAGKAAWAIGAAPDRIPTAYPVVGRATGPAYRVLWLGRSGGGAFPAPGGLADGRANAGAASVRFAVRDPAGASALDIGRAPAGPGYESLGRSLTEILAGDTHHGGALLASFGIRFVVAAPQDLPAAALRRLSRQIDLDLVPAERLIIFRNAKVTSLASAIGERAWLRAATSGGLGAVEALPPPAGAPLDPDRSGQRFTVPAGSGQRLLLLSQQFDSRWTLVGPDGRTERPVRSFGWAVGFGSSAPPGSSVAFGGQGTRTVEIGVLAVLWMAALWITRRPARHG